MHDILCTVDDNAHTLSHQTTVFKMAHPLQAGQHSPCIGHRTHWIYVITPCALTSHPLLYDITSTFCGTSYELYITPHPFLISSHYCTYDITASLYEITSSMRATYTLNMWHHRNYLCHHTLCIDNRRGQKECPLASVSKGVIYFLISYYNESKECLEVVKIFLDPLS